LRASEGLEVVGEAATGREAVVLARQERPDVVLMDVRMPGMDGLEATRQLVDAIEVVAAGDALLSPSVTRRLIAVFAALPETQVGEAPPVAGLTDRERDVLRLVARGLSNQEIGTELHIGYGTVKTYVSSLLAKLRCRDRAQLVMYAYESGVAVPRGR
jgi:DNA-binding NarL/FixJ family response regulator